MHPFRIGVAGVEITPEAGLPLMGNYRTDYAARGVHDPLFAKAMVFADADDHKAAVLALDLCMIDRRSVASMRRRIASRCSIPAENILIAATHTHAGPMPYHRPRLGVDFEPHRAAAESMLERAASAVVLADERLGEATLSVGHSQEQRVSFNRRLRRKDGTTQMNWEALSDRFDPDAIDAPWGPVDPEMTCLLVAQKGQPAAALLNFALHPAILAGDNWLYSADYPGALAAALAKQRGPDFTSVFLNGCCGNVNHVDYRQRDQPRGFSMVERVGSILAVAAHRAIEARTTVAPGPVRVSREKVLLERIQVDEARRQWCLRVLEETGGRLPEGQVDGVPDAYFADLQMQLWQKQNDPDEVEVMVITIGEIALVGLPGEVFCEVGMSIKRRSPMHHTLVVELANDAVGYLPTEAAFTQGGYEVTPGSTHYAPGAAERLADSALAQLDRAHHLLDTLR